jgi:L-lactate dehydrogenase (cytochrome)
MNHKDSNSQGKQLSGEDIAKHNSRESCWVIIHGKAYDVTEFLPEHPGGPKIILKYAGKDATEEFEPIHPPDTLDKYLDKSKHLGEVDMSTVEEEEKEEDPDEAERLERVKRMPILEQCFNLMDFEAVARRVMKKSAWAYYSSGADDEIVCFLFQSLLDCLLLTSLEPRQCAKTIPPSTKFGFDLEYSLMWKRWTRQQRCWVQRSTFRSM